MSVLRSAALLLALARPSAAEPGQTAAPLLAKPLGARASAMGGAYTAVAGGTGSLQFNPAAPALLRRPELTTSYLAGIGGGNFGFLAYAHPTSLGTLSGGLEYFNAGKIELNLTGGKTGTVTAEQDTLVMLGYSANPLPSLSVGGTYKLLRTELAQTARADASLFDLGALWMSPWRGLSAGAAYLNIGPDIKFESIGDPPPRTARYGVAWKVDDLRAGGLDPSVSSVPLDLTLSADMVQVLREASSPRLGFELGILPAFVTRCALRFGWMFNEGPQSFTFGAGFQEGHLLFDYGFGVVKDFNPSQQFSLSYLF